MFASLLGEVMINIKMSLHTASHILINVFHWQSTLVTQTAFTRTLSIVIKNKNVTPCFRSKHLPSLGKTTNAKTKVTKNIAYTLT
jgi:hypothetical protein